MSQSNNDSTTVSRQDAISHISNIITSSAMPWRGIPHIVRDSIRHWLSEHPQEGEIRSPEQVQEEKVFRRRFQKAESKISELESQPRLPISTDAHTTPFPTSFHAMLVIAAENTSYEEKAAAWQFIQPLSAGLLGSIPRSRPVTDGPALLQDLRLWAKKIRERTMTGTGNETCLLGAVPRHDIEKTLIQWTTITANKTLAEIHGHDSTLRLMLTDLDITQALPHTSDLMSEPSLRSTPAHTFRFSHIPNMPLRYFLRADGSISYPGDRLNSWAKSASSTFVEVRRILGLIGTDVSASLDGTPSKSTARRWTPPLSVFVLRLDRRTIRLYEFTGERKYHSSRDNLEKVRKQAKGAEV